MHWSQESFIVLFLFPLPLVDLALFSCEVASTQPLPQALLSHGSG